LNLTGEVSGDADFSAVKTRIGIVATNWKFERPYIFKSDPMQALYTPGKLCARLWRSHRGRCPSVVLSVPAVLPQVVITSDGTSVLLADGGYCANNPTLYAIADATAALKVAPKQVRVVSIGVGEYPAPTRSMFSIMRWMQYLFTVRLLQKTMEINTKSMEQLRKILFSGIPTIRINER
jgi:uncharacterized protein